MTPRLTTMVRLTDSELAALDGRCSDEVQTEVAAALSRLDATRELDLPEPLARFVADAVGEAKENGKLILRRERIGHCFLCGTSAGYVKFKSGPRKGENNPKRPRYLDGWELAQRFVVISHRVLLGGCAGCVEAALPTLAESLRGVRAELPERLRSEGEPRWVRHPNRHCTECGWDGHEGLMLRKRTVFGDGTYPAVCPECGAENAPLGRMLVEIADGYSVIQERTG